MPRIDQNKLAEMLTLNPVHSSNRGLTVKKAGIVLYQPICRRCHFIVKSSIDVYLAKSMMQSHLEKSHGAPLTLKLPRLSDFAELFKIVRTLNPSAAEVQMIRQAEQRSAFYRVQRLPKISVSGLGRGSYKLFLRETPQK